MAKTILDKEIRRQQILDAAIRAIARKGYRAASVSDVVFEAGVARGTFYLYFNSKEEIFKAILDYYLQGIKKLVMREMSQEHNIFNVTLGLRNSVVAWLRFFDENRDLAKIVLREAAAIDPDYEFKYAEVLRAIRQHWEDSISQLQKTGILDRDADVDFIGMLFSGMINQIALNYILPSQKIDVEKTADKLMDFIKSGLIQ